ncbi:response regulator [Caballeronia jiangsuensis]|uniref:Response regulator n=1 Tax=Caballeronia jiangsuensis TaxID=1458357 RepID=A0ABW9CXE6_9BURK
MSTIKRPPFVLLIDDEHDTRSVWCMVLELEGITAMSAANGEDGLAKAITRIPDLIITDFMMPGIDGLEVCRRVRADERLHDVPLILWSAARGIEARGIADLVVEKPVQIETMLLHVHSLVRGAGGV